MERHLMQRPNKARGRSRRQASSIFSAGVLLYEMLTGTWPFRGKTTIESGTR